VIDSARAKVYLVRHGETAWSITGQHTGRTDLPLTAHGEEQARGLVARLRGLRVDHVFSSPLRRALQTCELAGFGGRATLDPELLEWDYGEYEGRTLAQIHAIRPGWELFRDGCPGGESVAQVSARADRFVSRLRALGGKVLIFSSGHLLRVLAARWVECTAELGRRLELDPASVCVLSYEHDSEDSVIQLWNDARREAR
jgi:broad specificity phosphatase PhoE